jgi:type VI secretion system protein ImpM
MPAGLFGKLPAKRDFIAARAPRRFLDAFEPWLQTGLAASRLALGPDWAEIYNRAPLWRFWLGPGLCGEATVGVLMPSVDGVGRRFPLCLFSCELERPPAPPEFDANDAWFAKAETLLLGALDATSFEALAEAAGNMAAPAPAPAAEGVETLSDGLSLLRNAQDFSEGFTRARRAGGAGFGGVSYWWTAGGEEYPALAFVAAGLPSPARFVDLLTGAFAGGSGDAR